MTMMGRWSGVDGEGDILVMVSVSVLVLILVLVLGIVVWAQACQTARQKS